MGEPVFSELGIDDENAGLEGPILMGWHPSNEDLGYFATDRLGVLPRVAAATNTVITIDHASDCYPGQLHIWGERLQNLDAALAKLMMLEKPMVSFPITFLFSQAVSSRSSRTLKRIHTARSSS